MRLLLDRFERMAYSFFDNLCRLELSLWRRLLLGLMLGLR